ncbi:MAG: M50 family metallopeptidase, partial [Patescibacteria group bacterium]|nr:M50 family metallopeptidase [Patescibacteria group bacterium]
NLVFAWATLSAAYVAGLPTSTHHEGLGKVRDAEVMIVGVVPDSPAALSGLMPNDLIKVIETGTTKLAFETETLSISEQAQAVQHFIAQHQDESLVLTVLRGAEEKAFLAKAEEGIVEGRKALGIQLDDVGILQLPPHLALVEGARLTYSMTVATAQGLGAFFLQIARGIADFGSVAGPIGIVNLGAGAVGQGFVAAAVLTALISINLAIINLLPIPGLDGGRLVIIGIEGILRRPVSRKLTVAATVLGFALLITLMLVVSYHDIVRLVG